MDEIRIHPIGPSNRVQVDALTALLWGETRVVYVSGTFDAAALPGAAATLGGAFAGAVTWAREGEALRIVTIASLVERRGVGGALLAATEAAAGAQGLSRVVVSTTNDNLAALRFYQRNGYRLAALHPGAVDRLRAIKPGIPPASPDGLPIRDQIDLEKSPAGA